MRVDDDGGTVVANLVSRRFAWDEADHFAVMPIGRYPYVGHVVLRDGRGYGTFGIAGTTRKAEANGLQVQGHIAELNALLAARRGTG